MIQPSNFLLFLVLFGLLLTFTIRWQKLGRFLAIGAAILFAIAGFSPAANWLIAPLEDRFQKPATLEDVDGIIVLGGAVDTLVSGKRNETALTMSAERITIVARLAKKLPNAIIIHTGGQGILVPGQATEAEGAARLFADFGISEDRIILEDQSKNTWQNAIYARDLIKPKSDQKWLLVTSAYHMPRSMGVFEKAGWRGVSAYPVDYRTRGAEDRFLGFSGLSKGLRRFDIAFREWLGLVVYWGTGRSSELFPIPTDQ